MFDLCGVRVDQVGAKGNMSHQREIRGDWVDAKGNIFDLREVQVTR